LLKHVSTQDWGACVPSQGVDQSQSQSQRMVGPLKRPKKESQQIDRSWRRLVEALPVEGVAKRRRRQERVSPREGVAELRRRRCYPSDTHG